MFSAPVIQMLERGLDGAALKQKTITNNLANIDTPNYKAKQVVFRDELESSIKAFKTDNRHFDFSNSTRGNFTVKEADHSVMNNNGNTVDIDHEMAEMAKNQILYQALIQELNANFTRLKMVAKGGK
ncbi:flagellar basal body rod protein FlgB [Fictibacillus sp. Mic-4]|uniref:flagellar basal body rod protein FlgB n=1 Tax=Fictibacillus TaxID=1329200 RepID=UPI000429E94E|nr:flagellar basal body rod protein FlgB [Fictibacillus gelatini]